MLFQILKRSIQYINHKSSGLSSLELKNFNNIQYTLIKIFDNLKIPNKDLIGMVKIDVEGHEINVLEGMKNLLTTSFPVILIEYQGVGRKELINFFNSISYNNFYLVKKTGLFNRINSSGNLIIRFLKFILGFFIDPKFTIVSLSSNELNNVESEMLIVMHKLSPIRF